MNTFPSNVPQLQDPSQADPAYQELEQWVAQRVGQLQGPLFTTDAIGLFDLYLKAIPGESGYGKCNCGADRTGPTAEVHSPECPARIMFHSGPRQHYSCNCCRRFVDTYGSLAVITGDGRIESAMWDNIGNNPAPVMFSQAIFEMGRRVRQAKITGVFYSSAPIWGTPFNVPGRPSKYEGRRWTHLHGAPPRALVWTNIVKTAEQMAAEKREEHHMLCRGLADYTLHEVSEAVRILEAEGTLPGAEKALAIGQWLKLLYEQLSSLTGKARANVLWRAAACAPPGFCHIRTTIISTLLEDLKAGLSFEEVRRRWSQKMHPLQYKRPTKEITEGALKQAEELVAKLGLAPSLERRYATLDDIPLYARLWSPTAIEKEPNPAGGIFDHLRNGGKKTTSVALPTLKMSWVRFYKEVLPTARVIDAQILDLGPYCALITTVHPEAPPILQWDGLCSEPQKATAHYGIASDPAQFGTEAVTIRTELPRNPVSWYFHHPIGRAIHWNLNTRTFAPTISAWQVWARVNTICMFPHQWQQPERFTNHSDGLLTILEGCRDTRGHGTMYFPDFLRNELHGCRAVLEAHAREISASGAEQASACGLAWGKSQQDWQCLLRVTSNNGVRTYHIDRWE